MSVGFENSDAEMTQLTDWIKADPAIARKSMLHDRLQSEMAALKSEADSKNIIPFPIPQLVTAAAAAAVVIFLNQ